MIKNAFKHFCATYPHLTLEYAIEYFSVLGGMEEYITLDFFDDIFSMVKNNFVDDFVIFQSHVSPSYLLETPYREVLSAVARGDGKFYSVLKRARLGEEVGEKIVSELISLGILMLEPTREKPLRLYPKQKLKKMLRSYRIQDKLRFRQPFMRFWFGFVTPYTGRLLQGDKREFLENFENHYARLRSLVYEQLCNDMLCHYLKERGIALLSSGSYWDQYSEFDLLAVTSEKRLILGECKYRERKVCKNELSKLKAKAEKSGIAVEIFVLFSKSGFSNELLQLKEKNLLLFDLNDLKILL